MCVNDWNLIKKKNIFNFDRVIDVFKFIEKNNLIYGCILYKLEFLIIFKDCWEIIGMIIIGVEDLGLCIWLVVIDSVKLIRFNSVFMVEFWMLKLLILK